MLQTLARRSRRGVLGLVAGLVALALLVQPVAGQATRQLDQQQTAQDSFATYNNTAIFAQTFTAGLTGALDQVDLPLGQSGFVGGSTFTVEIRNVGVGGVPGSTVLASTTQPVSSLPVAAILPLPIASYSLSPGAPVVAGTQYAIVVSTTTTTGLIAWAGATGDPYPAGVGYSAAPPGAPFALLLFALDLAFQTFVSPVTLSVSNAQVTEGNAGTTHLAFPVTLSFPVGATVTATFSLANGTATGGPACATNVDFVNASGTVTIPAGSTTGTATVTVCPDTTLEPDETLTLALANPTNAVLGTATATGTILNDDVAPSPIIPAAPGQADVRIAKTGPANATLGSSPVYTITVTNSGPATAENVTINDPVPTGLTFISNSGACVTVFPCALGSLAAGQTRVITTTLNVPNGYGGPDPIVNVATVTSTTADPNTTNNTAQAKTTPQGQVYDPNNNGKGDKKDKDETSKQTEDQRRNREHTNTGGKDQYATSGQVIAVEKSPDGGYLLVSIKTIDDEPQVVAFACPNGECPDIIEKDVIEVDGVQGGDLPEQKGWFMAESFDYVTRAPRGR